MEVRPRKEVAMEDGLSLEIRRLIVSSVNLSM